MDSHTVGRIGIIGGTGLGDNLVHMMEPGGLQILNPDTPFGHPSASIITGTLNDVPIALLKRHGYGHVFHPGAVPYRANIFALKLLGCTHIIASGATGSLREHIHPGDLLICDQVIDRTRGRAQTFFEHAAVHVEFADPFCAVMRRWLLVSAASIRAVTVHERGCYLCMEGPAFSTRAESHLHRQWGADVVGMTAMPEARLAREAEIAYALIALPTDYDCWMAHDASQPQSLLAEIKGNLQRASESCMRLIREALKDVSILQQSPSAAHHALELAIWTDRSRIAPNEIERLRVLWGRYFP
jgi:5'-methylthioadenosine phosphorylase